jgi:PAS domain S-box-containing protein
MRPAATDEQQIFLSTVPARQVDRRLALVVIAASALIFVATAPFARVQLPVVWGFIPTYQSALAVNDLITAVLLYAQLPILRSRALLLLASGYFFTALMAVVHALTFPGLFAPAGLLGADAQSTAWLYMFWHGGFPLLVIGYALLNRDGRVGDTLRGSAGRAIALSLAAVTATVTGLTLLVTAGHDALPAIMAGHNYTPVMIGVVSSVWALSLVALLVLWLGRRHSVLDIWLMVVMCAWLFDIALAAVLNGGRFDLGFYVGRAYGFLAASFVLVVLLLETGALYGRLAGLLVAERREAAAEISRINAKLQALLDSSPLPVFSLDPAGRIETWNRAAERVFGYTEADAIGREFAMLPENARSDFDRHHRCIAVGEQVKDAGRPWLHASGRVLDIVYFGAPVRGADQQVNGAVYIAEDVTERKLLEKQLAQSQRMEAIGHLTGGVAHDFNNLLTVIVTAVEVLAEGLSGSPKLAAVAQSIDEAAARGAQLTQRMLAFARKQPLQARTVSLNDIIARMVAMLQRTLGEDIKVTTALAPGLWNTAVDPFQLEDAILNLAVNARDAMPKGGTLVIETSNVQLDEHYAGRRVDIAAGNYVMVTVSDSGSGMSPDVIEHAFEPFFTTKDIGRGTGLGLSMVYGFVKQSGGHVNIYSEVGHGTSIRLYLPKAAGPGPVEVEAPAPAASVQRAGGETVLIVEDDKAVRAIATDILRGLGYQVQTASDGPTALGILQSSSSIDLLFTDLIMPNGMSGQDLLRAARELRPSLKALFTSGYSEPFLKDREGIDGNVPLLGKPYRRQKLAAAIRSALDAGPGPPT